MMKSTKCFRNIILCIIWSVPLMIQRVSSRVRISPERKNRIISWSGPVGTVSGGGIAA